MKRLFVHPDGRLKTGTVSVLAFIVILGLAELGFEMKSRSEQEIVKIRHVFEEQTPGVEVEEVVQPVQPDPPPVPEKVTVALPQPKEVVEPVIAVVPVQKESVPEVSPDAPEPPPVVEVQQVADPQPVQKLAAQEAQPAQVVPADTDMEQLVALLGDKESDAPVVKTTTRDFEISDELRDLAGSEKKVTPPVQSSEDAFIASVQPVEPSDQPIFNGTVVSDSEVRLESKEYNEIFKSWRNAGRDDDGQKQLSFRVQNLRKNYQLLQMKPVVVRQHKYFDLLSGAPLLEEFLEEYSSLQLVVEKPWQEWQPELKRLGVRSGDEFNVRYLLYESIDRAMQHRVNMAFACSTSQGLIPQTTLPEHVEIIGRVFQISRDGGGRFGVFVPQTLKLKEQQQVAVPGQCFAESADVQMLMAAGMIQ